MLLGKVFNNIQKKYKSIQFKNIRFNSKECKSNDIFFAISGNNSNGNNYIKNAIKIKPPLKYPAPLTLWVIIIGK
mgnify:CR=1 FL=1